jgi:hypothetical protein
MTMPPQTIRRATVADVPAVERPHTESGRGQQDGYGRVFYVKRFSGL